MCVMFAGRVLCSSLLRSLALRAGRLAFRFVGSINRFAQSVGRSMGGRREDGRRAELSGGEN